MLRSLRGKGVLKILMLRSLSKRKKSTQNTDVTCTISKRKKSTQNTDVTISKRKRSTQNTGVTIKGKRVLKILMLHVRSLRSLRGKGVLKILMLRSLRGKRVLKILMCYSKYWCYDL